MWAAYPGSRPSSHQKSSSPSLYAGLFLNESPSPVEEEDVEVSGVEEGVVEVVVEGEAAGHSPPPDRCGPRSISRYAFPLNRNAMCHSPRMHEVRGSTVPSQNTSTAAPSAASPIGAYL